MAARSGCARCATALAGDQAHGGAVQRCDGDDVIDPPKIRHWILDADNNAVETDFLTWAIWLKDIGHRRVGYTEITSEITVSTVFIGIDSRFVGKGPPMLFETLIMGGPLDGDGKRYSSWDDAEIGHKTFVAKARAASGQKVTTQ